MADQRSERRAVGWLAAALLAAAAPAAARAASADLRLSWAEAADPNPPAELGVGVGGLEATYLLAIDDAGGDAATGVTVSATVPDQALVVAVANCLAADAAAPETPRRWFPCALSGAIGPSDTPRVVAVRVSYALPATCPQADHFGPVAFGASAETPDPDPTNNALSAQPPITLPLADLAVTMTGPAAISHGGGTYTFEYQVVNHGPCPSVEAFLAPDYAVLTGFVWVSATGPCGGEDPLYGQPITGDYQPDGSDYQYCDVPPLAVGESVGGTKTYRLDPLPHDLVSSNQGTGLQLLGWRQLTFPPSPDSTDPDPRNDHAAVKYVVTAPFGCASAGGGTLLGLAAVAAAWRARRRGGG